MKRAATTKRDAVWDHFTQEGQKWRCNYCAQLKPHRADRLRQHFLTCESVPSDVCAELFQRPSQSVVYGTAAENEGYQYVRIETVALPEERGENYLVSEDVGESDETASHIKLKEGKLESENSAKRKRLSEPSEIAQEEVRPRKRKTQSEEVDQAYQGCPVVGTNQSDCEAAQHVEESRAASASLQKELRTTHSGDS